MNLIKNKNIYLIFEDFSINLIENDNSTYIEIPKGIIEDGLIKNSNHLFYILKKIFDNKRDINSINIFISTSKILSLQMELPLVDNEDIDSMIRYEVENLFSINVNDYRMTFDYKNNNNNIIIDLRLSPKELIDSYILLFKDLKINLKSIYYVGDIESKYDNMINFSIAHTMLKNGNHNIKYIQELDFIIDKYNLNYDEIISISNNKQSFLEEVDRKKASEILNNYAKNNIINNFKNAKSNSIIIFGDFIIDSIKNFLTENLKDKNYKIGLSSDDIETNNNLNFIKRKKKSNYKLFLFFLIFLTINGLFFKNISYNNRETEFKINLVEEEKIKIQNNIKKSNLNSLKEQREKLISEIKDNEELKSDLDKNKEFEKLFLDYEDLNNENILFTHYYYNDEIAIISGISKDRDELQGAVDNCPYEAKLIKDDVEDGLINFKIKINLNIIK